VQIDFIPPVGAAELIISLDNGSLRRVGHPDFVATSAGHPASFAILSPEELAFPQPSD
jgi:hypothetical protein